MNRNLRYAMSIVEYVELLNGYTKLVTTSKMGIND